MTLESLPSQPPAWGFCNVLTAKNSPSFSYHLEESVTQERTKNLGNLSINSKITFLVVHHDDRDAKPVLCRYSGALPCHIMEQDAVFCYNESIHIVERQLGAAVPYIDHHFTPIYRIIDDDKSDRDFFYDDCGAKDRLQIKISPFSKQSTVANDMTGKSTASFIYKLDSRPCPLLSIFMTGRRRLPKGATDFPPLSESRQPLFWSCLKRQLVGCVILFDADHISTQLIIPLFGAEVQLQVTSVLPVQRQHSLSKKALSRVFVILPSTRITVTLEDLHSDKEEGVPALLNPLKDDTLLSPVAQRLVDTIHCMRLHVSVNLSRSILLTGPPGVGKTHAVRVAFQYGQQRGPTRLWSVRGSELLANNEANDTNASRALQRNFREALQYASQSELHVALIFLDECDALVSSNMTDENDTTTAAATATLAWLLDQLNDSGAGNKSGWQRVLMVAATNRLDAIPQFLRRPGRLDREMVLSPPSATERLALLRQLLTGPTAGDSAEHLMGPNEQELLSVADACVGYVPADLVALVRRATFLSLQEGGEGGDGRVTPSHLYRAMADVGASALRDAALSAPPKMGWDDVAGDPGGAKTALRQAVEWPRTRRASYLRLGLTPPRGILLHGPPGCAKTSLARAAAGASGIAFLTYSPADVYSSSYVGEAEAVVRNAFSLARSAAPCILFFDEIDAILGSASGTSIGGMHRKSSAETRVLSTFLNEMDGVDGSPKDGVLVLAATNRPWTLDAALLRPGRLEKIIFVPPPDLEGRKSILQMSCPRRGEEASGGGDDQHIDFDYLASQEISGLMTGAEIVGACREAASQVLRNSVEHGMPPIVTQIQLERAIRDVKPLLSNPSTMEEYQKFWKQNQHLGD